MAEREGPDIEQVSSSLDEGLKTCRTVVRSYRELLTGDHLVAAAAADNDDQPAGTPSPEIPAPGPLPE